MSRPSPRFANPQALSSWLESRLPSSSLSTWGTKPGTKNIHNLFIELTQGETSLVDSTPPVRTLNVVIVRVIGLNEPILMESHQLLSDGSVRERFRPLSEKMKPEETPNEAVFRAVKEELGEKYNVVKILPGSYERRVEERSSVSYPGLPASYVLHCFDVIVEGLPEEEFVTDEEEYGGEVEEAVTVKKHYWKWVTPDSIL